MNFEELMDQFKPGMVARRPTWEDHYSLQMKPGDEVRLHSIHQPKLCPVWRKAGYDALADDYYFVKESL